MGQAKTTINYIPLHDRVVVREEPHETTTKGGIIIPDTAEKEPKAIGIVVAHGCGFKENPLIVTCGDKVNYSKYAGSDITVDFVKYRIMRETDIFGIFPEKPLEGQEVVTVCTAEEGDRDTYISPNTGKVARKPVIAEETEGVTPSSFLEKQQRKANK